MKTLKRLMNRRRTNIRWRTNVMAAVLTILALACAFPTVGANVAEGAAAPEPQAVEASHGLTIVLPARTMQLGVDSNLSASAVHLLMALTKLTAKLLAGTQLIMLLGLGLLTAYVTGCAVVALLVIYYVMFAAKPARNWVAAHRVKATGDRRIEAGLVAVQNG